MALKSELIKGGSFLIEETCLNNVFTPEDLSDEHKMVAKLTADFIKGEVMPHDEEIENQNLDITVRLLKQAGDLGLLGSNISEEYGGAGLDEISSALITENMVKGSSFAQSHGGHVGIGSLPIVLFGTQEQKKRYLPALASGQKLAAYCLTEPSSGSDALSAKTTAVLNENGTHYILNGTKQFITNAGFADVFVVYAKIDGEKFTAFIVEKDFPGFSTGIEEKKMGLRGSSTRQLILEDCKVPVENVLGEIGKGHVIAFNILNLGRWKLGVVGVGTSKWALELAIEYAKERQQFGKPIADFPLIGKKLADMAIRTYAAESMVYRTTGLIENALGSIDKHVADYGSQVGKAIEEYALECSINKVFGSECLDFVADEGVQIHGGYGFTQEYLIERIYRDSRIYRIFEGTNEINRLLIPGTLLKRSASGDLPLISEAGSQKKMNADLPVINENETLAQERGMIEAAKKIFLSMSREAVMKYQQNIQSEQEILENLAELVIEVFAMESVLLRTLKAIEREGKENTKNKVNLTKVYIHEAFLKIENIARTMLPAMENDGEDFWLQTQLSNLDKLLKFKMINTVSIKREIALQIIEAGKYIA
jgi:alkylation response protein AidB-like acyl-CoA dehydrogenase